MSNIIYDSVCYKRFKSRIDHLSMDDKGWTSANLINSLIDELFYTLDKNGGGRKYVKFCGRAMHRLNLYEPPPTLKIDKKDISPTLYEELIFIKQEDRDAFIDVVTEAIRQLCEVSNTSDHFHRFIGKGRLRWKFV